MSNVAMQFCRSTLPNTCPEDTEIIILVIMAAKKGADTILNFTHLEHVHVSVSQQDVDIMYIRLVLIWIHACLILTGRVGWLVNRAVGHT